METINPHNQRYFRAQKKVKLIIGFYTHLIVTVFIIPFILWVNMSLDPQFQWFWFFIGAWTLGLIIHWMIVFGFSAFGFRQNWEERKLREFIGPDVYESEMNQDHSRELKFMDAKKKVEEIKGFYIHLAVTVFSIPVVIWVNKEFVPGFIFYGFATGGMLLALFFHWLGLYGVEKIGLGKSWQNRKINEFLQKENF